MIPEESPERSKFVEEELERTKLCDLASCIEEAAWMPVIAIGLGPDQYADQEWTGLYVCEKHRRETDEDASNILDILMAKGYMAGAPRDDVRLTWVDAETARLYI